MRRSFLRFWFLLVYLLMALGSVSYSYIENFLNMCKRECALLDYYGSVG